MKKIKLLSNMRMNKMIATCLLFLFGGIMQLSANDAYNKRLSINAENMTIKELLKTIETQSDFTFFYNDTQIDVTKKVKGAYVNMSVFDILNDVLVKNNIGYKISDRQIVLVPSSEIKEYSAAQQGIRITGKVFDETGEPMPGVNVLVKGTQRGVTSDINGQYSIDVPDANAVLLFSFVGYNNIEMPVGDRRSIEVTMAEASTEIDEVVVIGYGTQKKRDISTSISSVGKDDLKEKPVSGFDQAMAGKMAGVRVTANNAAPGGGQQITIRGINSVNAQTNAPLYVIDGFPLKSSYSKDENPLNFINPNDIESIEILKDASSSAIYGTQAANGVVMITTKRGKTGKPTISVGASYGIQNMINKPKMLNRDEFFQYLQDGRDHAYYREDPYYWDDVKRSWNLNDPDALKIDNWHKYSQWAGSWDTGMYDRWITITDTTWNSPYWTDWLDEITQTGAVQDYQISATGGTDNVSYLISVGYFDHKGIERYSKYTRYTARANVDIKATDNVKFGLNLAPSWETTDKLWPVGDSNSNKNTMFYSALNMPPIYRPYDEYGNPQYYGTETAGPWDWNLEMLINPLEFFKRTNETKTMRVIASAFMDINFLKDFTFRAEVNTNVVERRSDMFTPSDFPTSTTTTSRSEGRSETNQTTLWSSQNYLSYNKTLKEHSISAMVGFSVEETKYQSNYIKKFDYAINSIPSLNMGTKIDNALTDAKSNVSSERMIGSFGRLMYNYSGKYYLTASIRRDGSSKFGTDQKWGVFPSFSAAWRISGESFMKGLEFISDMKLRAGWGKIGNSAIPNYEYIPTLGTTSYFLGQSAQNLAAGYYASRIANDNLHWETTQDYDIGLDLLLWNGRIGFEYDYFFRKTEEMLFNIPLPLISGYSSTRQNIGSMQNKGQEFTLRTRNFDRRDFKWNTNFNIYYVRNKVTDIGLDKNPLSGSYNRTFEGRPLGTLWMHHSSGVYSTWEELKTTPIWATAASSLRTMPGVGMPVYDDVNGDGILDASDVTIVGNAEPDFLYGMTNTFEYKSFDLSVQITGRKGGDVFMADWANQCIAGRSANNVPKFYYDNYWRPNNTNTKYQAPNRKENNGYTKYNDAFVEDASYLNIQNVTLGYNVPSLFTRKIALKSARLYISVQNLFVFTKYHGFNPDVSEQGESSLSQGIDRGNTYPLVRTVAFGLNVSF